MNGIHAAFTGRIGKNTEVRPARDGNPGHPSSWRWTPRPTARPQMTVAAGGAVRGCHGRRSPESHQGRRQRDDIHGHGAPRPRPCPRQEPKNASGPTVSARATIGVAGVHEESYDRSSTMFLSAIFQVDILA